MKKFIPIALVAILLFSGCAIPKAESVSSVSSSLPSQSSAVSSYAATSMPTVTSVPSSVVSSVPQWLSSSSTVSKVASGPMTEEEFYHFYDDIIPLAILLASGQETCDVNDTVEVDGITYYKITDPKYDTKTELEAAFISCFTRIYTNDYFRLTFGKDGIYTEKSGFIYVNEKTAGATREFDPKTRTYNASYSIDFYGGLRTVQNGTDKFTQYYFGFERMDGEWRINSIETNVYNATDTPTPAMAKPVIYLYPEKVTDVTVKLDLNGKLGCTYPSYPKDGWQVTAYPDGKLIVNGEKYNYLFWEGDLNTVFTFDKGFCVKGEDTAAFLKKALPEMGLIPSEYNDFIVYWLPKMENNAYNLISFIGKEYTDNAKLEITPKPDSVLRVAMAYQPLEKPVEIAPQTFEKFERNGFTVVEWGGAEIE